MKKKDTSMVTISFACPTAIANELAEDMLKTIQQDSPRHVLQSEVRNIKNGEWAEVKDSFDFDH